MAPIFIPRIQRNFDEDDEKNGPMLRPLLRRSFSLRVFSYDVHFQSAPSPKPLTWSENCAKNCQHSPMTLIFIPRHRLRRSFSLRAFADSAYFHSAYSPIARIKKRRRGKKWRLIKILVIEKVLYFKKLKQNHI